MYTFAGYHIKNAQGQVVQFCPTHALADQFCTQNNLPPASIVLAYEFRKIDYVEPVANSLPPADERDTVESNLE